MNFQHIKRTGWVLRNVDDCETISGHMYRMGLLTFLLDGKNGLNRTKCMELGKYYADNDYGYYLIHHLYHFASYVK